MAGYYNLVPTDVRARTDDPAANLDQDNDGRIDNVAIWQGGVELRALWRGAALQAEWFGRTEMPGGMYAARSYWGGYVQASYFVIRGRLQVAGRIGSTDHAPLRLRRPRSARSSATTSTSRAPRSTPTCAASA